MTYDREGLLKLISKCHEKYCVFGVIVVDGLEEEEKRKSLENKDDAAGKDTYQFELFYFIPRYL